MVSKKELRNILWREKEKERWKGIEESQKDPNGPVQTKERSQQYYVDNMTWDSRPASVVGKEQGEHWWRFAPQAVKYRAELKGLENLFTTIAISYIAFWTGIGLWFLLHL